MAAIVEQKWGWIEGDNAGAGYRELVVPLDGREVSAEIALFSLLCKTEGAVGRARITRIVDANGTHDFDVHTAAAGGKGATSITFAVEGANSVVGARWIISFWA